MEQVLNKKEIAAANRLAKQQAAEQKKKDREKDQQEKIKSDLDKILDELKEFKVQKVNFLRNKIQRKEFLFGEYDNFSAAEVMEKMQNFTQILEGQEIFELCFGVDKQFAYQYDESQTYGFFAHWKSYETDAEYKERMARLLNYEKQQLNQYKQLQKKFDVKKK